MRAQAQLFAPGTSSRAKYAALVVGRPGAARAPEVRAHHLCDAGLARRARAAAQEDVLSAAPRRLGTERRLREGRHAPAPAQDPHRQQRGRSTTTASSTPRASTNRGIRIGNGVFIGRNTILSCKDGDIELGDEANIGFNCEIFSASRVTIGRSALIAAYSYVIGGDHDRSDPAKAGARSGAAPRPA